MRVQNNGTVRVVVSAMEDQNRKIVLRKDRAHLVVNQMHSHAAAVFDAAACLSPQVMPLDKAVGSHSKRSGTLGCLTIQRSTPPSLGTRR